MNSIIKESNCALSGCVERSLFGNKKNSIIMCVCVRVCLNEFKHPNKSPIPKAYKIVLFDFIIL